MHYFKLGWREKREPHYLFWSHWYENRYLVNDSSTNPVLHFFDAPSAAENRPHPLFDPDFYRGQVSDGVRGDRVSLLWLDYLTNGARRGLSPTPLFDPGFYVQQAGPEVELSDALRHYLEEGFHAGFSPSESFDETFYRLANPDVATSGIAGLLHFEMHGRSEGRDTSPISSLGSSRAIAQGGQVESIKDLDIMTRGHAGVTTRSKRINLLIPRLSPGFLTGGPNTALALMGLLSIDLAKENAGVVRICALEDMSLDTHAIKRHIEELIGSPIPSTLEVLAGPQFDLEENTGNEKFVATTWSTVQALQRAGLVAEKNPFLYLIQDFEPAFYPVSARSVLATETYELPHRAIVNTPWLLEFLISERVGRFGETAHQQSSLSFWPAINRRLFGSSTGVSAEKSSEATRRLVLYARPTTAPRNLYEIALAGLRSAWQAGAFEGAKWDFIAVGDPLPPTLIAEGVGLHSISWVSMADYAKVISEADVLVSLMASPHPSYPPLEGAVAGCRVVTNVWKSKTAEKLADVIPNVFPAEPHIDQVSVAISQAVKSLTSPARTLDEVPIKLPNTWVESFDPILRGIKAEIAS